MSNAERQARYRAKRATASENGERRLNAWITTAAFQALARLAAHNKLTQREMLEQLLLAADQNIVDGLELDSPDWDRYFNLSVTR